MRGRDSVIVTPRASFLCEMNCEPLAAYRCAITIVPLTRHAISDRVYYATYLSIGVLRQCRTTACAPSEEEEAGRRMFGRARFRVSVLLLVRFLSSRRITAAYQCQGGSSTRFSVCVCIDAELASEYESCMKMRRRWCTRSMRSIARSSHFSRSSRA